MADIKVEIGASNAKLQTVLNDTAKRLQTFSGSIRSAFASLAATLTPELVGAAAVGASFAGVVIAIKGVIEKGRELQNTMLRTGQSAASILRLQAAYRASGLEIENIGPGLNKLQKALSGVNEDGQETSTAFSKLGLHIAALRKLDAATQFGLIGAALQKVQNPADRAARVMDIFGKSGGEMLQLFSNPAALVGLTSALSGSQAMMARSVGMFARISQQWNAFIGQVKGGFGLFAGLAAGLAPALVNLMQKLPKIDLSGIGKRIGDLLAIVIQSFNDGRIGTLFGLSLKLGAAVGINYLYAGLRGIMAGVGTYFREVAASTLRVFAALTSPAFWGGLGHILTAAALRFEIGMSRAPAHVRAATEVLADSLEQGMSRAYANGLKGFGVNWTRTLLSPLQLLSEALGKVSVAFAKAIGASLRGNVKEAESAGKQLQSVGAALPAAEQAMGEALTRALEVHKGSDAGVSYDEALKRNLAKGQGGRDELERQAEAEEKKGGSFDPSGILKTAATQLKAAAEHMTVAFSEGFAGGKGPLKTSEIGAELVSVIDRIKKELAATTGSVAAASTTVGVQNPAAKPTKEGEFTSTSSVQRSASSLSKIGGGGYGNSGLNLQREGNSILKKIQSNTEQWRSQEGSNRKLLLGHLTGPGSVATAG